MLGWGKGSWAETLQTSAPKGLFSRVVLYLHRSLQSPAEGVAWLHCCGNQWGLGTKEGVTCLSEYRPVLLPLFPVKGLIHTCSRVLCGWMGGLGNQIRKCPPKPLLGHLVPLA